MKKLTDEQSDFIPSLSLVGGLIGAILFIIAIASCSTVHKVFNKQVHKQDSTAVTHTDSSNVHKEESKETALNLTDLTLKVEYDSTGLPNGVTNSSGVSLDILHVPATYSTPEGRILSDVIKSASQAGKVKSITIKAGKIDNTTKQITSSDSGHVKSSQNVNVKKTDKVIAKTVKRTVFWWWLIPIFLLVVALVIVYKNRHSLWARILKLFTPLI